MCFKKHECLLKYYSGSNKYQSIAIPLNARHNYRKRKMKAATQSHNEEEKSDSEDMPLPEELAYQKPGTVISFPEHSYHHPCPAFICARKIKELEGSL